MDIKNILKSNKITYYFITQVRRIQYFIFPVIVFNISRFLRSYQLYKKSPYERLKKVKNKHKGERCFIVATGPSLKIEDLEKLKNETTIGMNSICLAFDETDWRPTYYGIQDENVFMSLKNHIEKLDVECKFLSNTIPKRLKVKFSDDYYIFPMNMLNHNILDKKFSAKFSNDAFRVVYHGYSITYSLIQIAVYMGFNEIYLLGVDCNYSSNKKQHFKEYGLFAPTELNLGNRMISCFKVAKEYADNHNIKIYNATRGGMLEEFERVDLDEILSRNNKSSKLKKTI